MNQAVHEKQKAISQQFIEIADDIAKRLGLKTRLHLLNFENLDQPQCEIGVSTPNDYKIGAIDVELNVADCKARVTCALFRDLEDAVDDWTFDVSGDPTVVVQDETASAESRSPQRLCVGCGNQIEEAYQDKRELCATCYAVLMKVPVAMVCRNESCPEKLWVTSSSEATKCPLCGIESTIVCRFTCPNSECLTNSWNPRRHPEYQRACPGCGTEGKPVAGAKESDDLRPQSHRMRCTNLGCATREWDGGGHDVELCPGCKERGSSVDDDRRTCA